MALTLNEIDFLPDSYRQKARRRQDQAWRGLFSALFVIGIGAAAAYQQQLKWQAAAEFQSWEAPYNAATSVNTRLAAINASLKNERMQAQLFTSLRTPWPRSQLLVGIAGSISDGIVLSEIRIENISEEPANVAQAGPIVAAKPDAAKLDPLEKDLQRVRETDDKLRTIVYLTGETRDVSELHMFLAKTAKNSLFAKAQVTSIESLSGDASKGSRFTAQLLVSPAYGQPGGPKAPAEQPPSPGRSTANDDDEHPQTTPAGTAESRPTNIPDSQL